MPKFNSSILRIKSVILVLCLILISSSHFSQEIIENPEKPLNGSAGRVSKIKEVMRITDTGQKYFFENPINILIDQSGFIYFQEFNKLYVFDTSGKYKNNLYKKGEGPGELNNNLNDVILQGDEVILFSSNMNKIVKMDREGLLLEEFRPNILFNSLVGYWKEKYYLMQFKRTQFERKTQLREENLVLYMVESDGEASPTSLKFPITVAYNYGERAFSRSIISRLKTLHDAPRFKYLIHSPEYMVRLLDLEKVEIILNFRRDYRRLEYSKKWENRLYKSMAQPKYQNDVYCVLLHRENIWVVTSTYDDKRGLLVDVFTREGKYTDNFYLPLMKVKKDDHIYAPMVLYEDYLYIIQQDEEGLYSIVKYIIEKTE